MASEVIKLNLIPKGEMPVFHASQFDTGRLITCELYRGEDAYLVPEGYTVELHCRKVDNNIVTMASTLINDNVVTFTSTEQLTACNGNNLCEVAILDEGYRIGTLNFILEVEIDPLKGGITSTSEIHNLETQIEEITTEIVGENYYNKTEVDDLLDTKADASSVYTKTQVDSALALKANAADVYTKSQTDTMLSAKANSSDVYTKGQVDTALAAKADAAATTAALATKADKSDTYTKEQVDALIDNIFPTFTASGSIASFNTALQKPLVSITADAGATTVTACGANIWTEEWENGAFDENGQPVTSSAVRFKTFMPVVPGYTYYIKIGSGSTNPFFYDQSKNFVTRLGSYITNQTFIVPSGCYYMKIGMGSAYGTEYHHDISINYPSTITTYNAYSGETVPKAEADTLVTQSGVNNIYADTGDITVQYKYMSI